MITFRQKPLTLLRIWQMLRNQLPRVVVRLRCLGWSEHLRSVYGPKLVKRAGDRTFYFSVVGHYGTLIPDLLSHIEEPFAFIDIGANSGLFSLVAASNAHCAVAIAIEPVPETFATLVRNIALNRAHKVVPICGAVLNGPDRIVKLAYNPVHSGTARVSVGSDAGIVAPVIDGPTIEQILSDRIATRTIVKLDVEGAELPVLLVLRGTAVHDSVSDIVVEMSSRQGGNGSNAELYALMAADGFTELGRHGEPEHYDAHFYRDVHVAKKHDQQAGVKQSVTGATDGA